VAATTKRNKNPAAKDHPSATKMQTHKHNTLEITQSHFGLATKQGK
jgi:hypothetical protein